jgi:phosphomannomutase
LKSSLAGELIISVSGLRGVVGEALTPEVARRYAFAFAQSLPAGPVVVTRDGRANGAQFVEPVARGLMGGGVRTVLDGGIAATPTTGVLVRQHHCVGGIQISASHNPPEYNGLKLFSAEGRVLPSKAGECVLERYRNLEAVRAADSEATNSTKGIIPTIPLPFEERRGEGQSPFIKPSSPNPPPKGEGLTNAAIQPLTDTTSAHLALVAAIVDVERIRDRRFPVLLDANHGSGGVLGKRLLEHLGCELVLLGGEPDGLFDHPPEPTAENLQAVLAEVTRTGAQVGFCQDPDADRLAIIDEQGRYLGEEYTLAICANHVLRRTPGPVVTNCSTSRMTQDIATRYGVPFFRSAVGEANVVDVMLSTRAVFGGEGNGGVIDPRVVLVRDSFVGMALVLDTMAERQLPISALADELPRYAIHKTKMEMPREMVSAAFSALERHFDDATSDRLDGLRLDWTDGPRRGAWLLVRASNTEPIVRLVAEATDAVVARGLCDEAAAVIAQVVPGN